MEILQALADWPVAAFIRRSSIAYPLVNAAHILALALLIGAITTLDLRILGLFGTYPIAALADPLSRVAAAGLLGAVLTGFLLFSTRPVSYVSNSAFLVKVGLVVLGAANALLLHRTKSWRNALAGAPISFSLRAAATLSILIWMGAVLAGRWIGFLQ